MLSRAWSLIYSDTERNRADEELTLLTPTVVEEVSPADWRDNDADGLLLRTATAGNSGLCCK